MVCCKNRKMWKFLIFLSVITIQTLDVSADYNPSSKCPRVDGPDSVYFTDPDCSKFWQCSNRVAYKRSCPSDLHFNPTLNVCDYPSRAGCQGPTPTSPTVTTSVPTSTTTQAPPSTPSCQPPKTVCTCSCEVVPDDEPTTTSIWTSPLPPSTTSTEVPSSEPPCTEDTPASDSSSSASPPEPTPSPSTENPPSSTTSSDRDSCKGLSSLCPAVDGEQPVYIALANCSAFCQCSNGVAYYQPCPKGLYFNPTLNVCDYPDRAGCTGIPGTTPSASQPTEAPITTESPSSSSAPSDGNSCDRLSFLCPAVDGDQPVYIALANCSAFCQCSKGAAYYQSCPKGLNFNPTLNICDYPERAGCTGEPGTTPSASHPTEAPITTENPPSSSAPSDGNSCDRLSFLCPAVDGEQPVYIALANCSAFCQCSNGAAYYQPCPKGLNFNPTLNICDYPERAGCTGEPGTTPSATQPTEAPITTENPPSSSTPSDGNSCVGLSSLCPAVDGEQPVYIALANCSAFCQCSNGAAYYQPCPEGLNFNPSLNVCDYPERAGCTGVPGTTPSASQPTEAPITTENPPSSSTPSDGNSCDGLSSLCPAVDGQQPVYIALANCSAFCQCSNGAAYYQPCPEGLNFNPSLNVCDYPERAGCTGVPGTTPSASQPTKAPITTENPPSSSAPSDGNSCDGLSSLCPAVDGEQPVYIALANCSAFCQCSNGAAYYQPCPTGLNFNPTLNVCDYPERAGCTGVPGTTPSASQPTEAPITTENPPSSSTPSDGNSCDGLSSLCPAVDGQQPVYIALANCSAFCQCSNGAAYYQPCPEGLKFNPSLNVCDYPERAGCTGVPGTTPSASQPTKAPITTENPPSSSAPSDGNSCDGLSSLCPAVDGEQPVYIALANCSAFCQCSNGAAYYQPCPTGLNFNPTLNICDYPERAGCTGVPGTTPSASQPTDAPLTTENPPSSNSPSDGNSCDGLSSLCPAVDGEQPVYIALANCSAFCQCSNGAAYYQPCPKGLNFNPTLNICDYPERAGCTGEPGTTPSASQPTEAPITTENPPSDGNSCDGLSSLCPAVDGEQPVYIALANCSAFCQCSNGAAYYQPCPEGLNFNPILNVCDYPERAGCTGVPGTTPPSPKPTTAEPVTTKPSLDTLCEDRPDSDLQPHPRDCRLYISCDRGKSVVMECGAGLYFDANLQICNWPEKAHCSASAL